MSLDEDAQSALDGLAGRTNKARSEFACEALAFYTANFKTVTVDAGPDLEVYYQMLPSGEHTLLSVDFLHAFLNYVEGDDGEPIPKFLDTIDRVTAFHVREYRDQSRPLVELFDWLSLCDFLTVRASESDTFHIVFPTESTKWFTSWFTALNTEQPPFDIEVEEGIPRVFLAEVQ